LTGWLWRHRGGARPTRRRTLGLAVLLLLIGNLTAALGPRSAAGHPIGAGIGLLICLLCARHAAAAGIGAAELGLTGRAAWRSAGAGLAVVLAPTLLAVALSAARVRLPRMEAPGDLPELSRSALLRRLLLYLPVDTVLPEEIAFRAVLLADLRRRADGWPGPIVWSTAAFVAWHATLAVREVPDLAAGPLALKLAGYALGGVAFALPRLSTGNLLGCLIAYWLADAVLMLLAHPLGVRLRRLILGAG
jgi:hypothetical protein